MEGARIKATQTPPPELRLDVDAFDFVKNLSVGDKGVLRFTGNITYHRAKDEENPERKVIKFSNIISASENARLK